MPEPQELPPEAAVRRRSGPSPVWLVPIVAVILGGYLAWVSFSQRGPQIEISFANASGLESGKTKVRFKNVEIGVVTAIALSPDLSVVVAEVELDKNAERFATTGSTFWVVRPRLGTGGISGLETVVSGAYIEADTLTEPGARESRFAGLEEPPLILSNEVGTRFSLRAEELGSLGRGAPVFYRGIEVGQVLGSEIEPTTEQITFPIFVRAPFDKLVTEESHFWSVSGVTVTAGASGFQVKVGSLQSLLVGGVEFDSPVEPDQRAPAVADASFPLYVSREAVADASFERRQRMRIYFTGSVRGLEPGATVEARGIRIGRVVDYHGEFVPGSLELRIPVTIEIDPDRLRYPDLPASMTENFAGLRVLVERGLRAQLQTGSLLTGAKVVSLDFFPEAPAAELAMEGDVPVIPSIPTQLDTLANSATALLGNLSALPLDQLVGELRSTIQQFGALAAAPELRNTLVSIDRTAADLQTLATGLRGDLGPAATSLRQALEQANSALRDSRGLISGADRLIDENGPLQRDLGQLLRELQVAARSIRVFADYLERHPEALIRGKGAPTR